MVYSTGFSTLQFFTYLNIIFFNFTQKNIYHRLLFINQTTLASHDHECPLLLSVQLMLWYHEEHSTYNER